MQRFQRSITYEYRHFMVWCSTKRVWQAIFSKIRRISTTGTNITYYIIITVRRRFKYSGPLLHKCCFQYSFLQERKNHTIFPPHEEVWSWTHHFKVTDTRVVIIGQDPYHGPMQAHGLCFSVKHGVKPPPSLLNMYKELERDNDVQFIKPKHGFLEGWSKQGVLLLNAVLTVRSGQANSHKVITWQHS